jgi:hypothetical protein
MVYVCPCVHCAYTGRACDMDVCVCLGHRLSLAIHQTLCQHITGLTSDPGAILMIILHFIEKETEAQKRPMLKATGSLVAGCRSESPDCSELGVLRALQPQLSSLPTHGLAGPDCGSR